MEKTKSVCKLCKQEQDWNGEFRKVMREKFPKMKKSFFIYISTMMNDPKTWKFAQEFWEGKVDDCIRLKIDTSIITICKDHIKELYDTIQDSK